MMSETKFRFAGKKTLLLMCMLLLGITLHAQTVNLTLQVDMGVEIAKGNFNPATDVVRAAGAFQGWNPGESPDMVDDNDDSIYVMTYTVDANQTYEYKFLIGTDWGMDEFQGQPNRSVVVGATDVTVDPVFFNVVGSYTGTETPITFNVDMRLPAKGDFNPATDNVYVAGNFTDWGTGAVAMTDPDGDSTFTVELNVTSGSVLVYKYIHSTGAASSGTWESPEGDDVMPDGNRVYGVVDGENNISKFWNNADPNVTTGDGNILFQIDMSVMEEVGIYDPATDSVRLYGGFNGWNNSQDPSKWRLNPDLLNPSVWSLNVPFEGQILNSENSYKYYLFLDPEKAAVWGDGWERPVTTGGGNRTVVFEGSPNQEEPVAYYDGIQPDWVIPEGTDISVIFRVDMQPAVAANEFNPAVHSVYWIPEQPSFAYSQGWVEQPEDLGIKTDTLKEVPMTDPDGDMIYEGTLNVQTPTFNTFVYRYRFVDNSTGTWSSGETDGGPGAAFGYRVRFIGQDAERSFPVNPWTMPRDTWQDSAPKTDQETDPYTSYTGVKDKGVTAFTYQLDQNYPNPFNPSTKISFSIPEPGLVSLKIFNLLGEEVTTLVNEELKSGTFEVDFNASSLSSGIYFYTIKASNYTASKKMILMK